MTIPTASPHTASARVIDHAATDRMAAGTLAINAENPARQQQETAAH